MAALGKMKAALERRAERMARLDDREREAYRLFYLGRSIEDIAAALEVDVDLANAWIDSFEAGAPTL